MTKIKPQDKTLWEIVYEDIELDHDNTEQTDKNIAYGKVTTKI